MRPVDNGKILTLFRENRDWMGALDINSDAVLVYGADQTAVTRIKNWQAHGYRVGLLANFSHGDFYDWLNGKYDGVNHWSDVQTGRDGKPILYAPSVPYMIPSVAFTEYFISRILTLLETDIEIVCIEEPEFSVRAGYSETFKAEWELFYRTKWQEPHSSVDAQYKTSKLKAYMITRAIDRIATVLKYEAKTVFGKDLEVYISQSSSIESAANGVICPSAALTRLNSIDGFIGKVRAADNRTPPTAYGTDDSDKFCASFLQYGLLQELSANSDKKMIFNIPPVSSDPTLSWSEHRKGYERALCSALLHPDISRYEICPMAHRTLMETYPRKIGETSKKIPASYKTELLSVFSTLHSLSDDNNKSTSGKSTQDTANIGVLVSDTAMFQRTYPDDDKYAKAFNEGIDSFAAFYGLCTPLLAKGIEVRPVSTENLIESSSHIKNYNILILSYQFMKPESSQLHYALLEWVRAGGVLFIADDKSDSFNGISAWWNTAGNTYQSPADHLFEILGIKGKAASLYKKNEKASQILRSTQEGIYDVGKGVVAILGENPQFCAKEKTHANFFCRMLANAAGKAHMKIASASAFFTERGPYKILAVPKQMSRSNIPINGLFVDLLSPELSVETFIIAEPGSYWLIYDLEAKPDKNPEIISISAAVRNYNEKETGISFTTLSPDDTNGVCRFYCPDELSVYVDGEKVPTERDETALTVLFRFKGGKHTIDIKIIETKKEVHRNGKKR